jgi:DNA-binding NarL/FixJ family response regulator
MQPHEPIRILLVDDQPLFRGAIASLIDGRDDMTVVGEAENGLDAVEKARLLPRDRSGHRQHCAVHS